MSIKTINKIKKYFKRFFPNKSKIIYEKNNVRAPSKEEAEFLSRELSNSLGNHFAFNNKSKKEFYGNFKSKIRIIDNDDRKNHNKYEKTPENIMKNAKYSLVIEIEYEEHFSQNDYEKELYMTNEFELKRLNSLNSKQINKIKEEKWKTKDKMGFKRSKFIDWLK